MFSFFDLFDRLSFFISPVLFFFLAKIDAGAVVVSSSDLVDAARAASASADTYIYTYKGTCACTGLPHRYVPTHAHYARTHARTHAHTHTHTHKTLGTHVYMLVCAQLNMQCVPKIQ